MDSQIINQMNNNPVTVLWDHKKNFANKTGEKTALLKVAAYCRVSTELDVQAESFELQEQYYTNLIRKRPGWRLAGIYSDRGITGTQCKSRLGFQRMMRHCEEGKIDLILCKSISRFARNTVDLLDSIRRLKELKINVIFEKENIETGSIQSEFIITTLAAIAQDESRSISENLKWSIRKRFLRGEPCFVKILGYDVSRKNGKYIIDINESEARTVRKIYEWALEGHGYSQIVKRLVAQGYKTYKDNYEWSVNWVRNTLTNERYTGRVICQKYQTSNYLENNIKRNNGELAQYVIEDYHAPIIDQSTFDKVQHLLKLQARSKFVRNKYPLTSRFICNCGATINRFGTGTCLYRKWRCSRAIKSRFLCNTKTFYESFVEEAVKKAFIEKYNITNADVIFDMYCRLRNLHNNDNIERDRVVLKHEIASAYKNEITTSEENREEAYKARIRLEQRLRESEELWELIEEDRIYREQAISWIANLPEGDNKLQSFLQELNLEYMRAWVISVKALSPVSFSVRWTDNTETTVMMEKQNLDHRTKECR